MGSGRRFMGPEHRQLGERHEMVVGKQFRVREIVDGETRSPGRGFSSASNAGTRPLCLMWRCTMSGRHVRPARPCATATAAAREQRKARGIVVPRVAVDIHTGCRGDRRPPENRRATASRACPTSVPSRKLTTVAAMPGISRRATVLSRPARHGVVISRQQQPRPRRTPPAPAVGCRRHRPARRSS